MHNILDKCTDVNMTAPDFKCLKDNVYFIVTETTCGKTPIQPADPSCKGS